MKLIKIVSIGLVLSITIPCVAQTKKHSFNSYSAKKTKEFNEYGKKKNQDFEEYRWKRNEKFASYLREKWMKMNPSPPIPQPKENPIPPVVIPKPKDTVIPDKNPVIDVPTPPSPLPHEEVLPPPPPKPQPMPVDPIKEIPVTPIKPAESKVDFQFFGTFGTVRFDKKNKFQLTDLQEVTIADTWLKMSGKEYTNLIHDCLKIRREVDLCDWAYLEMLRSVAESIYGKNSNESVLLTAYIYCQSGYKMRLGKEGGRLVMLYSSDHTVYNTNYYIVGNETFYVYGKDPKSLYISNVKYPQEQSMSLWINRQPRLSFSQTPATIHKSKRDACMDVTMKSNQNMLDFYTSYPSSKIGENFVTRWAMYANMPMPDYVKKEVYPQIRNGIEGCDQLTALNRILNWVQTGFVYEYDDKVWGQDRAFFPEESLHYPYCDCEDRSILLTRIVRDILGLECLLVYYPGHLAAAVAVTDGNPSGDYFLLNGKKFYVTDGTIIGYGAPVGTTMNGMDNKTAKVILLD